MFENHSGSDRLPGGAMILLGALLPARYSTSLRECLTGKRAMADLEI